jgi:hypothetical protein
MTDLAIPQDDLKTLPLAGGKKAGVIAGRHQPGGGPEKAGPIWAQRD